MIYSLEGVIQDKGEGYVVLDVGGVGYLVFVTQGVEDAAKVGAKQFYFTYQHVREDILDLFGFEDKEAMTLFSMLLSISGVGPRSALSVLDIASIGDIKAAIAADDPKLLKQVSGIGPKLAERITLELKNKLSGSDAAVKRMEKDNDVIEGLISLGYSRSQALGAIKHIAKDISDSGERMKAALKSFSK